MAGVGDCKSLSLSAHGCSSCYSSHEAASCGAWLLMTQLEVCGYQLAVYGFCLICGVGCTVGAQY